MWCVSVGLCFDTWSHTLKLLYGDWSEFHSENLPPSLNTNMWDEDAFPPSQQQQHSSMSNTDKRGECKQEQCNSRWPTPKQPCRCLCIVKLLEVGSLSVHLSVYIPGVCPHGNSDQSESRSGSFIFWGFCLYFYFITWLSQWVKCSCIFGSSSTDADQNK